MQSHQCTPKLAELAAFGEADGQSQQEEDDAPGNPAFALEDQGSIVRCQ